jgi:hypothetical protein
MAIMNAREERDRYKSLTAAAVVLVAAIAAVISYEHAVVLALRYGQPIGAAYLLPVSIDGLVAVSSLSPWCHGPVRTMGRDPAARHH